MSDEDAENDKFLSDLRAYYYSDRQLSYKLEKYNGDLDQDASIDEGQEESSIPNSDNLLHTIFEQCYEFKELY